MCPYYIAGRADTSIQRRAAIDRLSAAWNCVPSMRLSQLILCATHGQDIFYMEDEHFIVEIESFAEAYRNEWTHDGEEESSPSYYTLKEVMCLLCKSKSSILRNVNAGKIPFFLPDGRKKGRRYPKSAIDALVRLQKKGIPV